MVRESSILRSFTLYIYNDKLMWEKAKVAAKWTISRHWGDDTERKHHQHKKKISPTWINLVIVKCKQFLFLRGHQSYFELAVPACVRVDLFCDQIRIVSERIANRWLSSSETRYFYQLSLSIWVARLLMIEYSLFEVNLRKDLAYMKIQKG